MPDTCENWPGPVNSSVYYAHQTREIYQVLPHSLDFKAPGEKRCIYSFISNVNSGSVKRQVKAWMSNCI